MRGLNGAAGLNSVLCWWEEAFYNSGMGISADVETAVNNAKAGQVRYRADKAGIVHCPIGKVDFEVAALRQNLEALLKDLNKAKPSAAKGIYLKRITVSTTMGPGLSVDQASLAS